LLVFLASFNVWNISRTFLSMKDKEFIQPSLYLIFELTF
jgi:hypothetical protein